jgi:hypothetical protein
MDTLKQENEIVERVLTEAARFYASPEWYETITLFDREKGQFLVIDEGWRGFERIHRVWIHVERRDDKWWIQQDQTHDGITPSLVDAGIPKERIVLAFQHPSRRKFGEFAAV